MANAFAKNEVVLFNDVLEGFEDGLVISKGFKNFTQDGAVLERAFNTVWRPQPYIAQSFTGVDQSSNFARTYTQLSVPITLSYTHSVPFTMSPTELRDPLQSKRIIKAAMQRLASDVNVDCSNLAALQGSIFVKRASAATGFDDVAAIDTTLNRLGVPMNDRKAFFSSGDYNSMASNLAARGTVAGKVQTAYEKAFVGDVAGFDTYKLDYGYRLTAALGTSVSVNGANQYFTPAATTLSADGLTRTNNDNRFQTLPLTVGGGTVKAGDAFTIAGVNEVHHITKLDTGSLKTFRIVSQATGSAGGSGNYVITPPIISNGASTDAGAQYKNVTATPIDTAVLTFLNTVSGIVNPFWQDDAFEIMPARYEPDPNAGMAVMSDTTASGITIVMAKQGAIGDLSTKYRLDAWYGLACNNTEMAGGEMFSQT